MHLLRYPPCSVHEEAALHHIRLLVRQATTLEILHTPAAGASLTIENRNFLNIPIEAPEPPMVVRRKVRSVEKLNQMSSLEHRSGSPPRESPRQQPTFQLGFPELIARGLLDRGESLGINKTVMNAVSELKVRLHGASETYYAKIAHSAVFPIWLPLLVVLRPQGRLRSLPTHFWTNERPRKDTLGTTVVHLNLLAN